MFLEMQVLDLLLELRPQLAFAEDDDLASGTWRITSDMASTRWRCPLCPHQRGDVADDGRAVREEERLVHLAAATWAMRPTSMPSCMVTIWSGSMPS